MLKKRIKYVDYDGNEREEDFYFSLNKAEVTRLNFSREGGVEASLQRMVDKNDYASIVDFINDLIRASYGEKSLDGKRFVKSKELSDAFFQTPAYDELFTEMINSPQFTQEFAIGVLPANVQAELRKDGAFNNVTPLPGATS